MKVNIVTSLLLKKVSAKVSACIAFGPEGPGLGTKSVPVRQVQKSDRINSDRWSGSDQLGSTRTNSDRMKK